MRIPSLLHTPKTAGTGLVKTLFEAKDKVSNGYFQNSEVAGIETPIRSRLHLARASETGEFGIVTVTSSNYSVRPLEKEIHTK